MNNLIYRLSRLRDEKVLAMLLKCLVGLTVVAAIGGCSQPETLPETSEGYKFGAIDQTGQLVVSAKYDMLNPFSEGLASVRTGEKWGLIDKNGQIVIKPTLDSAPSIFKEGLATVWFGQKCGFINKAGALAIAQTFDNADDFSNGLAAVQLRDKWGFIDRTGKMVISPRFDSAGPFTEGLAGVKVGDKAGFINKKGRFIIPPKYYETHSFRHGFAAVQFTPITESRAWGVINRESEVVVKPGLIDGLSGVTDDQLIRTACISGGKYGFCNTKGELVIPRIFDVDSDSMEGTGWFSEGLAAVRSQDKFGYIDKTGKMTIQPAFDFGGPFQGGVAVVGINGRYGYIDHTGKFVIKPKFDWAGKFWETRAVVGFKR